jgi:5'(3')-deoxyribonucleotidase
MKSFEGFAQQESREQLLEEGFREAVEQYDRLYAATAEAEDLMFKEKPAETYEEEIIARLELMRDGLLGKAEAAVQKSKDYEPTDTKRIKEQAKERAFRDLEQVKKIEEQMLRIYFEARATAPTLATLIERDHPWVVTYGNEAVGDDDLDEAA